jgi:uncharacterized membrane protein (DUF485 family)
VNSTLVALVTFVCILGAALLGTFCNRLLAPALSSDVKDAIKQVIGLIGMMASLALGLLVASANGNFSTRNEAIDHIAADIVQIDRALAGYGAEAQGVRRSLRDMVATTIDRVWPDEAGGHVHVSTGTVPVSIERVQRSLYALSPSNDMQKSLQSRALGLFDDLLQTRALALEQVSRSVPVPFLVVMVFWLSMLIFGINLFVAPNRIVIASMVVGALCLSAAIFLILDLDHPFEGLMRLSSAPLRNALALLGQ